MMFVSDNMRCRLQIIIYSDLCYTVFYCTKTLWVELLLEVPSLNLTETLKLYTETPVHITLVLVTVSKFNTYTI